MPSQQESGLREALLIVDIQATFAPPDWLVDGARSLLGRMPSVATVERHDESRTPFLRQLGWSPAPSDESLVQADRVFVKYGYAPTRETIEHLGSLKPDRVLVCGLQTETCVLAAGFALFDAGLQPTLITDLTVGSSLDELGVALWQHHFKHTALLGELLAGGGTPAPQA